MTLKESLKKGLSTAGAELTKHWLGLSVIALTTALIALLRGTIARWLVASTTLPNWLLTGGGLALLGLAAATIRTVILRWRARRKRFRASVTDTYLGVLWNLKIAPDAWIEENIKSFNASYTDRLIEGPYDAERGCYGSLLARDGTILPQCPSCGRSVPIDEVSPPVAQYDSHKKFYVGVMKHAVLLGLQQEHLRGHQIGTRVTLDAVPYLGSLV